jgi:hypothetical protein
MRLGRHICAIKGMNGARPIWPWRAGKSRKLPGSIGVDAAKDAIYSKLKVMTPGRGYPASQQTLNVSSDRPGSILRTRSARSSRWGSGGP